ncbi:MULTISPECIES: hypothetical protein [Pacificimonas]|uniref:Uncharacterized protein n=1 Tax=Pacificimonas aurantium TaxID=1250540 RepID=A0ABS7WP58_9SPHN|nr:MULTISPECIES: hypothetical protein [Pacificimonas]MBZ6379759.1 hypothetical protein [Pacificimonas aurantium]
MIDLIPSLQAGALSLLGREKSREGGIQQYLLTAAYEPEAAAQETGIVLKLSSLPQIIPYVNFDFERFSFSSLQSLLNCIELQEAPFPSTSWQLLTSYYSAFYSAHAIIRSQGFGSFFVNQRLSAHVNAVMDTYDVSGQLETGTAMYKIFVDEFDNGFMMLRPSVSASGVHDGFWRDFCQLLSEASSDAKKSGDPDSDIYVKGIRLLSQKILVGGLGTSSWLAKIRNELNYQHKHNVWFPETRRGSKKDVVDRIQVRSPTSFRFDRGSASRSIEDFVSVTNFLSCLNKEFGDFIASRSTVGGAFGQKWRRLLATNSTVALG